MLVDFCYLILIGQFDNSILKKTNAYDLDKNKFFFLKIKSDKLVDFL